MIKVFPALVFLAIRQAARLQALPYPLHDFAGAFLAAAPSFGRESPHAGPLITAKVKKPSPQLYLWHWIISSCSWSPLMRTRLVERIERRYDFLAVLGVKIEVSKGVHQRDVFGA